MEDTVENESERALAFLESGGTGGSDGTTSTQSAPPQAGEQPAPVVTGEAAAQEAEPQKQDTPKVDATTDDPWKSPEGEELLKAMKPSDVKRLQNTRADMEKHFTRKSQELAKLRKDLEARIQQYGALEDQQIVRLKELDQRYRTDPSFRARFDAAIQQADPDAQSVEKARGAQLNDATSRRLSEVERQIEAAREAEREHQAEVLQRQSEDVARKAGLNIDDPVCQSLYDALLRQRVDALCASGEEIGDMNIIFEAVAKQVQSALDAHFNPRLEAWKKAHSKQSVQPIPTSVAAPPQVGRQQTSGAKSESTFDQALAFLESAERIRKG